MDQRFVRALEARDPGRIGDYTLVGRLGQGGMGTVYLGRSPGGRLVAVKVVRSVVADQPRFRERFRREIDMARRVGGFWTAAVVDADPEATPPWLATEYVIGPSLHQAVVEHGRLPERSVRRLAAGLAEALTAIHREGLVHRDLKPSNVLLGADGPRVIDFGIARATGSATLTAAGTFLGTPGFLSPEQLAGAEVGPPSDVFSLGAVLIFACTGNGPFGAGDTATLIQRAAHGTPDLRGVPDGLLDIINACLRRNPEYRPTPAQLLASLGDGEALTPTPEAWLPTSVATLVHQQHTALRDSGIVTPSTVAGPTPAGTRSGPKQSGPPARSGPSEQSRPPKRFAASRPAASPATPPTRTAAPAGGSTRASSAIWGCVCLVASFVLWHSGHHPFGLGMTFGLGLPGRAFTMIGVLGCLSAGIALLVHAVRS